MRRARAWLLGVAAALTIALVAPIAISCPVCGAAKDESTRQAFVEMTVFMSLLPLLLLGTLAVVVVRRIGAAEREERR